MSTIAKAKDFFNRKILRRDKDRWNHQYQSGRWDSLNDLSELGRFSIIAGYAQHLKPNGKILEIGGGTGLLQQRFDQSKYSLYYSTDVSDLVIANAKKYEDEKTKYLVADMKSYIPDQTFDVIIFNEVVYYGLPLEQTLLHFNPYLTEGGIFIVSINGDERNASWHRMMEESSFPKMDQTVVTTSRNTFHITVLKKK